MKKFTKHVLALLMMGMFVSTFAQNDLTITKTIKDENKVVSSEIQEMKAELSEMQKMLSEMNLEELDGKDVEFTFEFEGSSDEPKETVAFFRAAKSHTSEGQPNSFRIMTTEGVDPEPKKKTFLGVYSSATEEGLRLNGIVENTAAEKAGLQTGDILLTFDDVKMNNSNDLTNALRNRKEGDVVSTTFLRNGQTQSLMVTLGSKTVRTSRHNQWSDQRFNYNNYKEVKRDPCDVFIGVTTGTRRSETGVKISDVIPNTPAEKAGLKRGDIITSIDGMATYSYADLRVERDKHEQGDEFAIEFIREGVSLNVVAQFKSCEKEEAVVEEVIEVEAVDSPTLSIDYTLEVAGLKVFPNPTYGNLTIQFEAEAVPTVVSITDVSGRLIYVDNVERFDGFYQKEISLKNDATPGMMNITIQQGDKVKGEKAILLPKA